MLQGKSAETSLLSVASCAQPDDLVALEATVDMASGQKRQFPYYSAVPALDFKRRAVEGFHPGQAHAEPVVHSFPYLATEASVILMLLNVQPLALLWSLLLARSADTPNCLAVHRLCSLA